jgi:heterotetrameric sarcosine oxidase delta subunit
MLRIPCPHCGLRDHDEFTYGGDAALARAPDDVAPEDVWIEHTYGRRNLRGPHNELWHHTLGCRAWLVVRRNTLTHEILDARPVRSPALDPP